MLEPARVAKLSLCNALLNSDTEPVSVLFAKSIDLFVSVSEPVVDTKVAFETAVLNCASVPVNVLFAILIDLFVNVSVVALPINVSVALGKVTVRSAVGSVIARVVSKLFAVLPSNTMFCEKIPADVTSAKLPVVITVPDTLGKVIVLSAVGSVTAIVVSKLSAVLPSNTIVGLLIVGELIVGLVKVLLVNVSVVALPTSVSVALGNVIVLSAVGSVTANVVSKLSAVEPSNIIVGLTNVLFETVAVEVVDNKTPSAPDGNVRVLSAA